ncbi:N-2CN'-diacetylbacillosaminyl-diphospho-undecaprenol alpha-1-2C3-N-acetylgalactosaminyltransferase [Mariniflexile rhizosphaerae]|uniref:glycosyltransferase family 4 protein n=1 Tax=unclassified Mariniflexile TaxID=2643887 RepID=UPI000CC18227|nr:glycosyltransferase family 4 protein [Mariniflexile sp. TRM1-10]AXP80580.1 N-2CN'-diacetylbacillosaminyl-diphospho-undecaprenol alpha-1-2C3-N-acetylgalactosaminyltransferase [Mariniflexile sp. TRM1-10]PLB20124.1 MAG: Glycosyl transferase [Flavobacteriaceae bacterium FS1-H7996/R]
MKERILLIGPFPSPISGVSLANEVLKCGLENKGKQIGIINTQVQTDIKGNTGKFSINKILFFFKVYLSLYKILFFDIVNITIGQTFFGVLKYLPFLLAAKIFKTKTVIHLHGGFLKNEYENQKSLKKKLMLFTLRQFDYGIVLSKSLKEHLSFFLDGERIFICKNFFESSLKSMDKEEKNYEELRLIFLSNLIEGKGINLLLEALEGIDPNTIKVKVAGNITPENKIVVSKMERFSNLEYLGVVSGKAKTEMLSWGNVFCLPTFYSRGEGQPISIIEAMAFGNLILTTKHGGIPDICTDNNAIFVEKNNVKDLKSKILFLISNRIMLKKKGELNKVYAEKEFAEDVFVENMIKIFDRCLS